MLSKSIRDTKGLTDTQVRTMLISLHAPADPVEILFFNHGWDLITKAEPTMHGRVSNNYIRMLNTKDPQTQKSLLDETGVELNENARDAIRLRLDPNAIIAELPGQAAQPLAPGEAGQGGRTATDTPLVQDTAIVEVNEANLTRFLDRLGNAIRDNDAEGFTESEFEIQAMTDALSLIHI